MDPDNNPQPTISEDKNRASFNRLSRILIAIAVVFAVVLIGGLIYKHNHKSYNTTAITLPAKIAPAEVSITSSGFMPATIKVKVGQSVVWTNNDTKPHIVASDPYPTDNILSGLNSKQDIKSGGTYSYIFNTAGTYTYHDNLNPSTYKGTVVVSQSD